MAILNDGTSRSSFFCFQICVVVSSTEVCLGYMRLIDYRFAENGTIQVCSTQISFAEIYPTEV